MMDLGSVGERLQAGLINTLEPVLLKGNVPIRALVKCKKAEIIFMKTPKIPLQAKAGATAAVVDFVGNAEQVRVLVGKALDNF